MRCGKSIYHSDNGDIEFQASIAKVLNEELKITPPQRSSKHVLYRLLPFRTKRPTNTLHSHGVLLSNTSGTQYSTSDATERLQAAARTATAKIYKGLYRKTDSSYPASRQGFLQSKNYARVSVAYLVPKSLSACLSMSCLLWSIERSALLLTSAEL